MYDQKSGEPFINIMFANFFEPAYSDKSFVDEAVKDIKAMGFNNVMLDSKSSLDFFERFEGKEPSQFVMMQEYIMHQLERQGLSHNFLALYMSCDNLYPTIRFSPPVFGESVKCEDGSDGGWYKYWSDKAQSVMTEHVRELLQMYSHNYSETKCCGKTVKPICSMWDPVIVPSFDDDGVKRYLSWLEKAYSSIDALNEAYQTEFSSFSDMTPQDYWFSCKYGPDSMFTDQEIKEMAPHFRVWSDNMKYRRDELHAYFKEMKRRLKQLDPSYYLSPNLAQWGLFLNVDSRRFIGECLGNLWDTSNRGIDPYILRGDVDDCWFIALPATPAGDPDAYAASCQFSMMRNMNRGRDFTAGLFFGRFIYNDLYRQVTPAEIIGSAVGSGATQLFVYGYDGLDDGGILHRMPDRFKASIAVGNNWAKKVIPMLTGTPKSKVAILFPAAMALLEPFQVQNNDNRRMDMLGVYKACCDAGFYPDVIHPTDILDGRLLNYSALIMPANDCYAADRNIGMEKAIAEWAENGGVLLNGPDDPIASDVFHFKEFPVKEDCFVYKGEKGIPQGTQFFRYDDGDTVAQYENGGNCIVRHKIRKGLVYSFGFSYGYTYVQKECPNVPSNKGNKECYSVPFLLNDPFKDILRDVCGKPDYEPAAGIEVAMFDNGKIVINHTSYPFNIEDNTEKCCFQYPSANGVLAPHSAVFIKC